MTTKCLAIIFAAVCLYLGSGCKESQPLPLPDEEQAISPLPTVDVFVDYEVFRGLSVYNDPFQLQFQRNTWELPKGDPDRRNTVLSHLAISDCALLLREGSREWPAPDTHFEWDLGNYRVYKNTYLSGRTIYSLQEPVNRKTFLFAVLFSDSISNEAFEQCHADAEDVISTFQPQ